MKQNIAIVFGGNSAEHEVSVITATQIINGYTKEEFNILPIFLDKNNEFYFVDKNKVSLKDYAKKTLDSTIFKKIFFRHQKPNIYLKESPKKALFKIDACVNCCHGGIGENGELVALLNSLNIPISSANVFGLASTFDKVATKFILKGAGIDCIDFVYVYKEEWEAFPTKTLEKLNKLKFPLIVKPARQGSSIGINKVNSPKELVSAIKIAFEFDNKVLIEKAIINFREFNCSAIGIGGDEVMVSSVDEPVKIHDILTFEDKYIESAKNSKSKAQKTKGMNSMNREFLPSGKLCTKIKDTTKIVMRLFNLSGVIRVDYIYDIKKKRLYLNEINAVPGSLAYYFWAKDNISINDLLEKLVLIAKKNKDRVFKLKNDYSVRLL